MVSEADFHEFLLFDPLGDLALETAQFRIHNQRFPLGWFGGFSLECKFDLVWRFSLSGYRLVAR